MDIKELICKKKLEPLESEDFDWISDSIARGELSDRQILEFVKALNGYALSDTEVYLFAKSLASTGELLNISEDIGFCVDKHSVGMVSDGVTLILMSALASLDVKFVKSVSSIYDGYGSFLARLNSFKGFNCQISKNELIKRANKCFAGIYGSTNKIAPAADKIYKVCKQNDMLTEPIISASIMASKIATGASMAIVDIKSGEGEVSGEYNVEALANRLVNVGKLANIKVMSVITDLNWPISASVGLNLELQEIKDTLSQAKEYNGSNLLKLAKEMVVCVLISCGKAAGRSQASEMFDNAISSGKVYQKFCQIIDTYGGDITSVSRTQKLIDTAVTYITADYDGYISDIKLEQVYKNTEILIGEKENADLSAGLVLMCGEGDKVITGQKLAKVFYSHDNPRYFRVSADLFDSFKIAREKPAVNNLFYKVVI